MSQSSSTELYQQYQRITQKAADFNYAAAVLGWDQEVYMPPKGFSYRGRQLATLATGAHELLTSRSYGDLLKALAGRQDLTEDQQDNIRLSTEDYEKQTRLPAAFVERITQQTSNSYQAWIDARRQNDFSLYAAELEKMIVLKKEQTELYGYQEHPYDALLDDYEKGASVSLLDPIFRTVAAELPSLLDDIKAAPQVDDSFFYRHFPKEAQFAFSVKLLEQLGYDLQAGRQDYSEHPFSTSFAPTDVRVTTRVDEQNIASLIWSSIHEGGHAMYEQGLPEAQYGMPLGAAVSLSIHESQSRLWENCVGRSLGFWEYFLPQLKTWFPEQLGQISPTAFYKATNRVEPSLIRTEADEVTYHFHVMIRYEIEKQLIAGMVKTADLPGMWNDYYQKYLGVSSPDDKQGILQDVHWSHGSFGYFPTYSLGSFYAAQFFEQAEKDIPGLAEQLRLGQFTGLLQWLRQQIHQHGRRYRSEELCKRVTGRGLDFSSFMRYATKKYSGIYNVTLREHVT